MPLSVSEAEFMTLTHAYVWVKWVREMIIDFGFPEWVEQPTVMLTDNRNAQCATSPKVQCAIRTQEGLVPVAHCVLRIWSMIHKSL